MTNADVLADHEVRDVLNLLAAYAHRVDTRDAAGWAQLFETDGSLVFGGREVTGTAALTDFAQASPVGVHVQGVPDITAADNGNLTCVSSWTFLNAGTGQILGGSYLDSLTRHSQGLRFAVRRVETRVSLSTSI